MMDRSIYESPFTSRYKSSKEMLDLFSEQRKIETWRTLWFWLAKGQKELGLHISTEELDELERNISNIDWSYAEKMEAKMRHDVMAHIEAYRAVCPAVGGKIHQGATSAYVQDNADLMIVRDAIDLVQVKIARCIHRLSAFAQKYKELPTVGRTHYQAASLTTVGKRACLWIQELLIALRRVEYERQNLCFRGIKGATGSKDSFLKLFDGDAAKVDALDARITSLSGFNRSFIVTGQTYPRLQDACILNALALIGAAIHQICMDLRMLQCFNEIQEPFGEHQVGSSAMPWKKNPMRSERCCGFARYLMNLPANALQTTAVQGFERTLDDSVNRRLVLSEAFLTTDALLETMSNITEGLIVHEEVIREHVLADLPFLCMETILMELVKQGHDRQEAHARIRQLALDAGEAVAKGKPNDLLSKMREDSYFAPVHERLDVICNPSTCVGMCPQDTERFLSTEVNPALKPYEGKLEVKSQLRV